MKRICLIVCAVAAIFLSACAQKQEKKEMKKVLVAYFGAGVIFRGWPTQPPHRLTKIS